MNVIFHYDIDEHGIVESFVLNHKIEIRFTCVEIDQLCYTKRKQLLKLIS